MVQKHHRMEFQLEMWVQGKPHHNYMDNCCCPDFSCCIPDLLQPVEVRKTFMAAWKQQNRQIVESMVFVFSDAQLTHEGIPHTIISNINEQ
jgi:hypothetical protein